MRRSLRIQAITALLLTAAPGVTAALVAAPAPAGPGEAQFVARVLPVLQAKCLACHGGDRKQVLGGLDLTTHAGLLRPGASRKAAVVPGRAADSPLYRRLLRTEPGYPAMPPKESDRLSPAEVTAFREWIDAGAPWPSAARIAELRAAARPAGVTVRTSGGLSAEWSQRRYKPEDVWAFRPVRRPSVPKGASHPVDAFLNAGLASAKLKPAPPADRRTLIRRVTFDLTGLPPAPEEVDAFLADTRPGAYERVVDRLLASPHFGEQMARHWLDVVRYADSSGFANDYERGSAWRYRDYVVRSFNQDRPYHQFVREQLAGDEIDPADPEKLVAVGFLRMGAWELTGMEVPKVARQRFLDDMTDTVGQVFLGQMLQCARCHDHKFDPVPTRDYYRIQAAFATTQVVERPAPFLPAESRSGFEEKHYLDERRRLLETELRRIEAAERSGRDTWERANPDKRGQKPPRHLFLSPADLGLERIARKGLERLRWEYDRYEPVALSVYSGRTPDVKAIYTPFRLPANREAGQLESTHVLPGGDPFSPGERVVPGVLSAAGQAEIPETLEGRRKALAEWITHPGNPLAARVMVNRVWQWTFGTPLAGNPNNFGATGKKPTHPELLDWLAATFVAEKDERGNPAHPSSVNPHPSGLGWSVKRLVRLLVTSAAYRRSSRHPEARVVAARDPQGTRHAVFRPRRLAAEELQDALLAASGELNREMGGIPVRPEINPEVALQPRQVMGTFAPVWEPSPRPEQRHRRSLYALRIRGLRDPLLEVFNAPAPDSPCEMRESSTVAPQAFSLFNSESTRLRALALAGRARRGASSREQAMERVFRFALGRRPTPPERAECLEHWSRMAARHRGLKLEKPLQPETVVREAVEENTGERFRFTERLVTAPDFVPDLHPADADPELRGLMEVCLVLLNSNEFLYLD